MHDGQWSGQGVADLLGVDGAVVYRWIREGTLRACRGERGWYYVEDDDLLAFMENPGFWPQWEPANVPDSGYREWAMELRQAVRYLDVAEVAKRLGYTASGVCRLCQLGKLKAAKAGQFWRVDERDLEGWAPKRRHRRVTERERNLIERRLSEGWTQIQICHALKRHPATIYLVAQRYLARGGTDGRRNRPANVRQEG